MQYLRLALFFTLLFAKTAMAQLTLSQKIASFKTLKIDTGVTLTIDEPASFNYKRPLKVILYALPNGNTTSQTFGKKLSNNDDWHFDIQHIGAQTAFIRETDKHSNYVVVYAENDLKSWPAWRKKYKNADQVIANIVTSLYEKYKNFNPEIYLTGHSGGGSFIFGYIGANNQIADYVKRIGFIDATYAYNGPQHKDKLLNWLEDKNKALQIIAYNDSVVVLNGKPLVSPKGGTWYRSQLMAKDLAEKINLSNLNLSDRMSFFNKNHTIDFVLIKNPEAKIYHTNLVDKNGFISLIFNGTKFKSRNYTFWSDRAYSKYISD
ncbi:hypothetical protein [Pedobacter sp.]|uniref:hypothetical protein n=1 Tax=Pedobacter sp. TaxID=1411316 RepID=UPI00396C996C